MALNDGQAHLRPVVIAPAPPRSSSSDLGVYGDAPQSTMPYSCQGCAKRKVKCDKAAPACSTCRKGRAECLYQAPAPRWRKRKLSGDIHEKLARYERILLQNGLLPQDTDVSPSSEERPQETPSRRAEETEPPTEGTLLAGQGRTRYIESHFWRYLGDDELQHACNHEDDYRETSEHAESSAYDPLTVAFVGFRQSLLHCHPTHEKAMLLWKTHVENVEPICKILHIPTVSKMVQTASKQPELASETDECTLFSIYHFAVYSMTDAECTNKLGQPRAMLMPRYRYAARQALVNASFLKTTEMSILQALVLFLIPCRFFYDSHTFWILTGVALRIAQRMGIHRDGEKLGLSAFDVEMRRRLCYQLLPLDGIASHMSGAGMILVPDEWDTQPPSNLNDDQIWPGMEEAPTAQNGATEMIFFLTRSCLGKYFVKAGKMTNGLSFWELKDFKAAEKVIDDAESEVEEKYIRYCDIVNPLHVLTIGMARSATTAMRLRIRLPKVKNQTATNAERRELFRLSQKIIDTDTAAYLHPNVGHYLWHVRPFFLWGSWDSMIFVLTTLWKSDLLSPEEVDATWARLEQVYQNHAEFLEPRLALNIAFGRLTLKAWEANPPSNRVPVPAFIATLESLRQAMIESRADVQQSRINTRGEKADKMEENSLPASPDANTMFSSLSNGIGLNISDEFLLDPTDWIFWDKLIQDYQAQGNMQPGEFSQ